MTDIGLPFSRPAAWDLTVSAATPCAMAGAARRRRGPLFAAWESATRSGMVTPRLLPAPGKVWNTLVRSLDVLLEQAQPTFWGAVAGILLAARWASRWVLRSPTRAR